MELDKEQFEGIVKFATILPQMNPEVAKKALEQFLEFEKSATELVSVMKDSTDKGMDANIASINSFDETCDTILEILREQLKEKEITPEQNNLSLRR